MPLVPTLALTELVANLVLSVILIVGAYQFYFFTQRHRLRPPRVFHSSLDERIPFVPAWSWAYSFLYYPAILYLNLIAGSSRHFVLMAFSFIVLLALQMLCFALFPVATPPHWRKRLAESRVPSPATRFLGFVRSFDASSNCFPSMHVSVATLTALHAFGALGPAAFAFPICIAVSCVLTKQHYLIDLPFGALLGWLTYQLYLWMA
jgi:hypothetical protein